MGDQQAALFGQAAIRPGLAKATYGTGSFLLAHAGDKVPALHEGLISTIAWDLGSHGPLSYAYEGSAFVAGAAIQWLRDELGIISSSAEINELAARVTDSAGVSFVPAFSGLFAPYWRSDARGAIVGLSRFNSNAHIARATLEAICYQSRDVVDAMAADSGVKLEVLKVDGGVTLNELCMQIQANVLGVDVVRPKVPETTALGAAYAAGLAVGYWSDPEDLRANWQEDRRWTPQWTAEQRAKGYAGWKKAVSRTLDWVEV
jgi:glycerol kinase